ncbi:30S ribosomal protein S19 [Candidatus Falkowbacteria bacterium CG_4_9_14_3_um_filter_36_9]|uniref:Small ribosomal subunit protein uS19 n=2 Tax=Candidatus Falkowiibacteriota TaxID=1752728 RepID=A0A1J4TEG4_9BACT|nr:MAG: 30S ribosomal protein S19 [Candidatus Falkowbacteria bacterium CG1_02_37_44]PIV51872.1 MAG: 30S ribosomal protein S19 [Candidatus Falkowbacteria bacterium CG02_land_8_20_14_3_00_36_14]PIX12073.1 MAG: 30S ribosomal protein S19 [Candidatus Falkowbacteria bacterium CG_4_8_14_3_um_filter_36_11]PJA10846.1 MAG: 30S ribosomal protein S19 [Candidatus Falkowbacteria bacterium CG_4_10_14_0_2_um_filter_36_22]PJB20219.1 MAG: 30S ribosomal protein S19 [Candidatus Falkowbacteria bacterium CG_4_9_14_3
MSRSLKKGPYVNERIIKKLKNLKPGDKTIIKVWDRAATITPEMVGFTIGVHNGRQHIPVYIVENMVGHKLGEFSFTRKFVSHGGRMAKEQSSDQKQDIIKKKDKVEK